jgi:hypothetical protein
VSFDLLINNGDLVIGNNGDVSPVTDISKLEQDLLKIALTTVGANTLQPWYGSLIGKTLVGSYLKSDIVITMAKIQLQNCIEILKNLQAIQTSSGQPTSPGELIASISNISVVRNTVDPRIFQITIRVINRAFGQVVANFSA